MTHGTPNGMDQTRTAAAPGSNGFSHHQPGLKDIAQVQPFSPNVRMAQDVPLVPDRAAEVQSEVESMKTDLAAAVQAERHRLARTLHDDIAQSLFVARMQLSGIIHTTRDHTIGDALRLIEECLTASSDAARTMMADLDSPMFTEHPATLLETRVARALEKANQAKFGNQRLVAALTGVGERFLQHHGLFVEIEGACRVEPSIDVRAVVLRSVRELLMNIVKYAGVTHARIHVGGDHHRLYVQVSDEGVGYDVAALKHHANGDGGYGLRSINECLAAQGSTMEVVSGLGEGTKVVLSIPVAASHSFLKQAHDSIGS